MTTHQDHLHEGRLPLALKKEMKMMEWVAGSGGIRGEAGEEHGNYLHRGELVFKKRKERGRLF